MWEPTPYRPKIRTDPEVRAAREAALRSDTDLIQREEERLREARRDSWTGRDADSGPPPNVPAIVVPDTWWGWLLVAVLATIVVLSILAAGKAP